MCEPASFCLHGRVALVTGAGRGIGARVAEVLVRRGASLAINDLHRYDAAASLADSLGSDQAMALQADVTDPVQVEEMVRSVVARFGALHILINCVGGSLNTPRFLEEISAEQWRDVLDLSLTSQFYCSRASIPHMKRAGWGRIVNISSSAGVFGEPLGWSPAYAAAKAGVLGLTRQIALEFGPMGITANAVAPGDTETERTHELWESSWPETPEQRGDRYARTVPLRRAASIDEVAETISFLASDAAGFVTGETINVNGGQFMR